VLNKDNSVEEQGENINKETANELKKHKDVMWDNFLNRFKKKIKHIEDALAHNYGEINETS
jgi:hypothetical protein